MQFFKNVINRFTPHVREMRSLIASRLLPPLCVLCSHSTQSNQNLCQDCLATLPALSHHCRQCAQDSPPDTERCLSCLTHPKPFERTYVLFPYQSPITELIVGLKFQHQLSHAEVLGELLAGAIQSQWYQNEALPDMIIPMPLHPLRLCERGFNQALEIARPIAKATRIPIDKYGVIRCRHTAAQSSLPAKDRRKNVSGAFVATKNYAGLTLAVIDDVITTGNTLHELCQTLKTAGAKTIHVWCAALAQRPKTL